MSDFTEVLFEFAKKTRDKGNEMLAANRLYEARWFFQCHLKTLEIINNQGTKY